MGHAHDWTGSVAVITGGARGIGLALATRLTEEGARCALLDVEPGPLEDAARAVPDSVPIQCDVTDPAALGRAADLVAERFGRLDLLAANAGVTAQASGERLWEIPDAAWRWLFDINVFGVVNTLRAFVPQLIDRPGSRVLITASLASYTVHPMVPEYFASKHAVASIADTLRLQFAREGFDISVTSLAPGQVSTDIARWRGDRFDPTKAVEGAPLVALGPAAVAHQVVLALGDRHPYVFTHPEMFDAAERRFADVAAAAAADLATFGPSRERVDPPAP